MNTRNVLLVFGGESAEHEVSISSARNVYDALDKHKYQIALAFIDRHGRWWKVDTVEEPAEPQDELNFVLGEGRVTWGSGESFKPNVILPILHGPNGEDGSVQGMAQLLHVPIVGCGIIGSAICMDKDVAKRLLIQQDIQVVEYMVHRLGEPEPNFEEVKKHLGDVAFVKPAQLGSSVGVSKVHEADSLHDALRQAHQFDRKVILERAIVGREIECSILGNDHPEASVLGEIKPTEEFYSYDAKYSDDSTTEIIVGADLPPEVSDRIRDIAVRAYRTLECRGCARADFFLGDDGVVYLNELNTMPGFTNISMYPKLWEASGIGYSQLLDRLVDLALQ